MRAQLETTGRPDHPAVSGKPLRWLQGEAVIEVVAALLLFRTTHQSWWLAALILAPDVLMLGYVRGTRVGAASYNLAHSHIVPILLCLVALEWHHPLVLAAGLLWLAHIGLDRAMTFGLKYDTDFQHTHLGDHSDATPDRRRRQASASAGRPRP